MTEDELFVRILADPDVHPRYRYGITVHSAGLYTVGLPLCMTYSNDPFPGVGEGRDREVITRLIIKCHGVRNVSEALGYTPSRYRGLSFDYMIADEVVNVDIPI